MGNMFVVGHVAFDYNDEYHSTPECGGSIPIRVFTSSVEAKEWVLNALLTIINDGEDWRLGTDIWDENFETRWRWYYEYVKGEEDADIYDGPYSVYNEAIDFSQLVKWCVDNDADPLDYLPKIFSIDAVEVGA